MSYNADQPRAANGRWGTSDNVRAEQVGTHAAGTIHNIPKAGGGRLGLNPLLAALLGTAAGIGSAVLKPALRGRHGKR
jgi:hypothetical protein